MTKEQQIRERLARIIDPDAWSKVDDERRRFPADPASRFTSHPFVRPAFAKADAILREFALRPVSQGKVDSETGEVEGL